MCYVCSQIPVFHGAELTEEENQSTECRKNAGFNFPVSVCQWLRVCVREQKTGGSVCCSRDSQLGGGVNVNDDITANSCAMPFVEWLHNLRGRDAPSPSFLIIQVTVTAYFIMCELLSLVCHHIACKFVKRRCLYIQCRFWVIILAMYEAHHA